MNPLNELMEKELAAKREDQLSGMVGTMCADNAQAMSKPDSLRDRVAIQRRKAEQESNKVSRLAELESLMDTYPDIVRMLVLLTEVGL